MASSGRPLYVPSDDNVAPTILPEHAVGFIDLKTLTDIHRYLNESEVDTDIELAIWIERHYLYKPIGPNEEGRVIRTAEGFAQLDRAYRRVRNLTGKAQDKWPFFDRSWKTMSSVMVRNNSRGESAPGVSLSSKDGEVCDSPMSKVLDMRNDEAAQTPTLQVPFGKRQPGRPSATKSYYINSTETTPVSLPQQTQVQSQKQAAAKQTKAQEELDQQQFEAATSQVIPKYTELPGGTENQTITQSEPQCAVSRRMSSSHSPNCSEVMTSAITIDEGSTTISQSGIQGSLPSESAQSFPIEDAGKGKIRGPNGRYLPKKQLSSKKSRGSSITSRVKHVKKGSTAKAEEPISPVLTNNGDLTDENVAASISNPQTPAAADHLSDRTDRKLTSSVHSSDMHSNRSTPQYTLAVEAESVASNLDKLPPGFIRRNKRKSEPTDQQGQSKRVHRELSERSGADRQSHSINQNGKGHSNSNGSDMPSRNRIVTRRAIRRSVNNDLPSSDISTSEKATSRKQQQWVDIDEDMTLLENENEEEKKEGDKDSTLDYEDGAHGATATKSAHSLPDQAAALRTTEKHAALGDLAPMLPPPASVNDLLALGLSKTTARSKRSQPAATNNTHSPSSQSLPRLSTRRFPIAADRNTLNCMNASPNPQNLMTDEGMIGSIASSDFPIEHDNNGVTNGVNGALGADNPSKVSGDADDHTLPTEGLRNATDGALPPKSLKNGISHNPANGVPSDMPSSKNALKDATNGISLAAPPVKASSNTITSKVSSKVPGIVEFVARIHTRTGVTEIPLTENYLTSDTETIKRYAEWKKQEEGMEVSFEQFSRIFGFAKKG